MRNVFHSLSSRLAAIALSGALIATGALAFTQKTEAEAKVTPVLLTVDDRPVTRDVGMRTSFSPIVKKVGPCVVKVLTTTKARNISGPAGPAPEDFLRRFFGDEFENPQRQFGNPRRYGNPRQQGLGSGVIVTRDGYILTNNHVVDGADRVKVTLQDGREFDAKVVGRDPKSEVAVIKIDANDLPAISIADSDNVEVGDVVLAVGNPFGIGQTVTTGIVSAKDRASMGLDYEDFIQTDAAINPGNSGGALVDADGRLIGINTAILSRSGGNQGIGFAIPTNLARDVMESLIKDGSVTRGFLGVVIQDVTPALAKQFKLKDTTGALVGDVTAKSPAEKAGIKSGDVIVEFNGKDVSDSRHLKLAVGHTQPGDSVQVKILRDGAAKTFNVTVKELPGSQEVAKAGTKDADDNGTLNGVGVTDIDEQVRQQFRIPANVKGAVITDVEPDSAAAEAGIRPGDIIQEINREPVKNAEEAVRLTENPKDKTTLLRVWREGRSHFVIVDESKAG